MTTKPNEPEALERYTIHLVAEEASEAIQMTGKWGRFGPDHARRDGLTARAGLALELGDVLAAIDFALCAGLIDPKKMLDQREAKFARLTDPDAVDDEGRQLAPPLPSEAARLHIAPAQPVADAGGVTDADRKLFADLLGLDAVDDERDIPRIMAGEFDDWKKMRSIVAFRLQSVAAATAAKDAEIARLREALSQIAEGRNGSRGESLPHDAHSSQRIAIAALSEAREAGV